MAKETITLELTQGEYVLLMQAIEAKYEEVAESGNEVYQNGFIKLCEKLGSDFNQEWIDEHNSHLII